MKHIFLWLSMAALLGSCALVGTSGYVEFDVEDVSREQVFIDSTTGVGFKPGGHVVVEISMEGELDSAADVSFRYYTSNQYVTTFDFRKEDNLRQKKDGKIPYFKTRFDFYGDTLLIRYIPKGATKGHLKIRTNIL